MLSISVMSFLVGVLMTYSLMFTSRSVTPTCVNVSPLVEIEDGRNITAIVEEDGRNITSIIEEDGRKCQEYFKGSGFQRSYEFSLDKIQYVFNNKRVNVLHTKNSYNFQFVDKNDNFKLGLLARS